MKHVLFGGRGGVAEDQQNLALCRSDEPKNGFGKSKERGCPVTNDNSHIQVVGLLPLYIRPVLNCFLRTSTALFLLFFSSFLRVIFIA